MLLDLTPQTGCPGSPAHAAACCLVRDLPLATFDIKDFADYEQHEGLELIRE